MDNTLESLLRYFDSVTGLDRLSTQYWLAIVMATFLFLTILSELFIKQNARQTFKIRHSLHIVALLLISFSILFTLSAWCISYYTGYYYNFYVVLGLIAQMISALILSLTWSSVWKSERLALAKKIVVHLNIIVIILVVSGRWLIRGVDAEETSADTLNIYYNGGFRYSMHAGWYDLAPVDSIFKVIMLWINGVGDPYSPFETFLISFCSSLTLYFLVYVFVKDSLSLGYMLPLIPALLVIHPYSFLPGAHITPTNIAIALALSSLLMFLVIQQRPSRIHLTISIILFITSMLAHPFSLLVLILIAACLLAKYSYKSLTSQDILFFLLILTLWLIKTAYTATIYGITSTWNSIVNGVSQFWERETLIAFRSPVYSELPKLSLASFSASVGIIGGLFVVLLYRRGLRSRSKNLVWYELVVLFFTSLVSLAGFLAIIGGQSRYIFLPFASLFFTIILFYSKYSKLGNISFGIKVLLTLAAILTVFTPNFIPDQYSFYTASKISDEVMFDVSKTLFEKLDPNFVVSRYQDTSAIRLYFLQRSKFVRNEGWTGLIVDKLILHDIIKAKSYWDFLNRGPFDIPERSYENSSVNIVVDSDLAKVLLLWITH